MTVGGRMAAPGPLRMDINYEKREAANGLFVRDAVFKSLSKNTSTVRFHKGKGKGGGVLIIPSAKVLLAINCSSPMAGWWSESRALTAFKLFIRRPTNDILADVCESEAQVNGEEGSSKAGGLVVVTVAVCRVKELSLVVVSWKFRGRLPRFGPLAALV